MRVAVVMVALNRREMFRRAVESLNAAAGDFSITVVELDSCDGTTDVARRFLAEGAIRRLVAGDRPPVLYQSFVRGIELALAEDEPEALLLTAEDYDYRPDWYPRLTNFLLDAPPSVSHVTLDTEPDFPWNEVRGVVDAGGSRALIRHTAPGANWAMTLRSWRRMEAEYRARAHRQHLDNEINQWAREQGLDICALDLCEHVGATRSLVGNDAYERAKPLDRARWGLPAATPAKGG